MELHMRVRTRRTRGFLDEMIAERAKTDPEFPQLVEAAYQRRKLLRALGDEREKAGISQTDIAARMRTSQSAVARLEAGGVDAKMSTLDRFALALGKRVQWRLTGRQPKRRTAQHTKSRRGPPHAPLPLNST